MIWYYVTYDIQHCFGKVSCSKKSEFSWKNLSEKIFQNLLYSRKSYKKLLRKKYVYHNILKVTFSKKSGFLKIFDHLGLDHCVPYDSPKGDSYRAIAQKARQLRFEIGFFSWLCVHCKKFYLWAHSKSLKKSGFLAQSLNLQN